MTTAARVTTSAVPAQSEGNDPLHAADPPHDDVTAENGEVDCPACHRPVPPKQWGGKPKIYCSTQCRKRAAYRRLRSVPIHDRPTPRRSSRRPLPNAAHDAGLETPQVRRARRADHRRRADRRQQGEKVAVHLDGHLSYAADTCARMISQLHEEG